MRNRFSISGLLSLILITWLFTACDNLPMSSGQIAPTSSQESTPTPLIAIQVATPTAQPLQAVKLLQLDKEPPTPPPLIAAEQTENSGELVMLFSTEGNTAPQSNSLVYIFSNTSLVDIGETEEGIYRTVLPAGIYDLAIVHESLPASGYLQKGVTIEAGETITLALPTPLEGKLDVVVRSKSSNSPQKPYLVIITSDGQEITSKRIGKPGVELSSIILRADMLYDVSVRYDEVEVTNTGVVLSSGGTSVELLLPFDEGILDVIVRQGGQPLTDDATVVVVDSDSKEMASDSKVRDQFTTVLPAGREYIVRVQYLGEVQEMTVPIEAAGLHPVSFDFPPP